MRVLEKLQGIIERTYDLESGHSVSDFVVTCPEFARAFNLRPDESASEEQVLVSGDSAAVDLAVCLDDQVLSRLRRHDPLDSLHDGNLDAFWTALEGVSHFVYLVWNASRSRQVTQLELELQAEVDKFVTTALLVAAQQGGKVPTELHSWLFDLCRLDESLAQEEADRYARANRYAGRFCQQLASRYLRSGGDSMFPEIRRFYRLSQRGKLRHIESARARNR